MHRLQSLHNKTQIVDNDDMPYNSSNILITGEDLKKLFQDHGLNNFEFHNLNLYRNAFVHRSYCTMKNDDFTSGNQNCPDDCLPLQDMSYERLEFLGDSILGAIVSKYLYQRYSNQSEGFLSKLRTKIVNGKMLGHLGKLIGFPKFAIISKQIEESQGRDNYKIMEDIFEAFIGAIVIDFDTEEDSLKLLSNLDTFSNAGFHIAEIWIINIIEKYLDFAELLNTHTNYKDMLVRHMQYVFQDAPRFFEINIKNDNGIKKFRYTVKDRNNSVLGTADGISKKDAENNCSKQALIYYGQEILL